MEGQEIKLKLTTHLKNKIEQKNLIKLKLHYKTKQNWTNTSLL